MEKTYQFSNTEAMKTVIGVIGTTGSGKDVVGERIAQYFDIPVAQTSQPLKDLCKEKGLEPTRDNLIALGSELAKEQGDQFLVKLLLEKFDRVGVITGMRELGQINYLRANTQFLLIAIEAKPEIRFERVQIRKKAGEATSLEEFIAREKAENSAPNVQRLFQCMKQADHVIENSGTLEELYEQVENLIKSSLEATFWNADG